MSHFFSWIGRLYRNLTPSRRRLVGRRIRNFSLYLELLEAREVPAIPTFTPLTNLAPDTAGEMMLLTNGTVMVQDSPNPTLTPNWFSLTADAQGNYVDGTWGNLAPMNVSRLFFGSAVLPSGDVFVIGGEYASDHSFSRSAELYNPQTNSWAMEQSDPQSAFGDDPVEVLPNGQLLLGDISHPQTYIFDPATDSYALTGTKLYNDQDDEECWVKLPQSAALPQGGILKYDLWSGYASGQFQAQIYNIASGQWQDASNTVPDAFGTLNGFTLSNTSTADYEEGPGLLLPDGEVLIIGATGKTALYDPTTNTWEEGPNVPGAATDPIYCDDAPGAVLADGQVVFEADSGSEGGALTTAYNPPAAIYDYDETTNTITNITSTLPAALQTQLSGCSAFTGVMCELPNGQVLFAPGENYQTGTPGTQLYVITPGGTPQPSWQPTITSITGTGPDYTLTGTQINGLDEGANYGDDIMQASNYPIIELASQSTGNVYFATTSDWTSDVATGNTPETTQFTLPAAIPDGAYSLTVSANGISSAGQTVSISNGQIGLLITPGSLPNATDGVAYPPVTITAANGTAPYSYQITSGHLPTGMSFSLGGVLSGTPTEGGSFTFTVTVTDSSNPVPFTGFATYTLTVDPPIFTLHPAGLPNATDSVVYPNQTITAKGGVGTDTVSLVGALPSGLNFNAATGVLSGTPTEYGIFVISLSVADQSGSANGGHGPYTGAATIQLVINPPNIAFTPASGALATGTVGVTYNQQITASGGVSPYEYDVVAGTLPGGLFLNPGTGAITGVPIDGGGPFHFTVAATDSSGSADGGDGPDTVTKTFSLNVNPATLAMTPAAGSLPQAPFGQSYTAQRFTATGGTGPYSYSVVGATLSGGSWSGGGVPPGLTVTAGGGVLSGTATVAGTYIFAVMAEDSSGGVGTNAGPYTITQSYSIVVNPPIITVNPQTLPSGQVGQAYGQSFSAQGSIAPYTFSIVGGTLAGGLYTGGGLPGGLALTTAGQLSGTPTEAGTFGFAVVATDSSSGQYTGQTTYTVVVTPPDLEFDPADLPIAKDGHAYGPVNMTLTGGTGPASFALIGGALPDGLSFTDNGNGTATIKGLPTESGVFAFTVEGTDPSTDASGNNYTRDWTFDLTVNAPTITFSPGTLTVGQVGVHYSVNLTAQGGTAPYSGFTISKGALPAGLSLSAPGGVPTISGLPTTAGNFAFTVAATDSSSADNGGQGPFTEGQTFNLSINTPTISITPTTLADAQIGVNYNQAFTASGGIGPYQKFQISGGALPTGMSLTLGGTLTGMPTATGTFFFDVEAEDSSSGGPYSGTASYSLVVDKPTVIVAPTSLPAATAGVSYDQVLAGSGGTAPYSLFVPTAGGLPPGLSLALDGELSGTPTAAGTFTFTVRAQDSSTGQGPYQGSTAYTFVVKPPVITVAPSSLSTAQVGVGYTQTISASGGNAPYGNFSITGGALSGGVWTGGGLPAGLGLSTTTGVLSGTPTAGGTFNFTIAAQDSTIGTGSPFSGTEPYTLVVAAPTITLGPPTLQGATDGITYSVSLSAAGGTAPYTYSFVPGAGSTLPPGMSVAANGTLAGMPTGVGTFTFQVQALDSSTGNTAPGLGGHYADTSTFTVTVAPPTITVAPGTNQLPAPTVGQAYSTTVTASGGTAGTGYTFSLAGGTFAAGMWTGGNLPAGLALSPAGVIGGTPTAGGNSLPFTVQATDNSTGSGAPFTGHTAYTLAVNAPTLAVTPATLTAATDGVAYSAALSTSGGTAPYAYTVAAGSTLPPGLSLSSAGAITGTPSAGGNFTFTVTATDTTGGAGPYHANQQIALVVGAPTISATPLTLTSPTVGQSYSTALGATGGVAGTGYTFSLSGGTLAGGQWTGGGLPAGLSLTAAGLISGTPTAGGTFNFVVGVTDHSGGTGPYTGHTNYVIAVNPANLIFNPPTLSSAQVGANYGQTLSVTGGTAPYSTFAIVGGTLTHGVWTGGGLPAGITMAASTGTVSGIPTGGGSFTFTVQVTDSSTGSGPYTGQKAYTLNVTAPTITIGPGNLPSASVYSLYSQQLTASGGTAPYTNFTLVGTSSLPAGISLTSGGTLIGTPKVTGSFTFTVQVTDSSASGGPYSGIQAYTLTVQAPPIVVGPALSPATVGTTFSEQLIGSGGMAPYGSFTVVGGTLPAGLTLSQSGLLSGTPTAGGSFSFTIDATDSSTGTGPYTGGTNFTLNVQSPTIVISPNALPVATVAAAYTQTLSAKGGTAPYSNFQVVGGSSLPAGMSLSSSGVVSGTPTAGGTFPITVQVSDSSTGTGAPYTGQITYTLTVAPPTITLGPSNLPDGTVAATYSQQLTASGGIAPYQSFALIGGSLPAGLQLSSSGLISGTPTARGPFNFTVSVLDSSTGKGPYGTSTAFTLVVDPPTISVGPSQLTAGTVAVAYSQSVSAAGGTAPYTGYQVVSGSLPAGLTLQTNGTITGTPTAGGSFTFAVAATDSTGGVGPVSGSSTLSMTVNPAALAVTQSSLPSANQYLTVNDTLTAQGGTAPYSFTVISGKLPPGVSLAPDGALTGAATAVGPYSFTVQVTDSSTGTGPYSTTQAYALLVATPVITINATSNGPPQVGVAFTETFSASGANAPYKFTLASGSLPAGVQLASTGVLSGTPTAGGTFTFTVKAVDSSPTPFSATDKLTLTVAPPTLVITPALPAAQVATAYSQQLTLTGGTGAGRFVQVGSGLPAGLTLSSTGLIAGTPTAGGTFTVTVRATDSTTGTGPYSITQQYTLTVAPPAISILTQSLPDAQAGVAYRQTVTAHGGTGTLHYSIVGGTLASGFWSGGGLPAGIKLSATTGILTGTPSTGTPSTGGASFTLQVTDSSTGSGPYSTQQSLTLIVQTPESISFIGTVAGETSGAVDTFQVQVLDQSGNAYNGPVTIKAVLKSSGAVVSLTTTSVSKVQAQNGVATFTDVTISTRALSGKGPWQFVLIATAGSATARSNAFTAGTSNRLT